MSTYPIPQTPILAYFIPVIREVIMPISPNKYKRAYFTGYQTTSSDPGEFQRDNEKTTAETRT